MMPTDEIGQAVGGGGAGILPVVSYTAFGEAVWRDPNGIEHVGAWPGADRGVPPVGRYAYAGGFGHESGMLTLYGANPNLPPITLQHVGARWYQPNIGRFVQRDPIGIRGGLNVYAYCRANPLKRVDPDGLIPAWVKGIGVAGGVILIGAAAPVTVPGIVIAVLGGTFSCMAGADELGALGTKIGEELRPDPPEDPPYPPDYVSPGDGWRADPRYPGQ